MTVGEIVEKYKSEFGEVKSEQGFSLSVTLSRNGNFVVKHYYEPNNYKTETVRTIVYDKNGIKK